MKIYVLNANMCKTDWLKREKERERGRVREKRRRERAQNKNYCRKKGKITTTKKLCV